MSEPQSRPEELPTPDAALVLWRVAMEAFLSVSGRKKGEAFLRVMAETLATEETVSLLLPIRPQSDHAAVQRARREAMAAFRQHLPVFLARLDKRDI